VAHSKDFNNLPFCENDKYFICNPSGSGFYFFLLHGLNYFISVNEHGLNQEIMDLIRGQELVDEFEKWVEEIEKNIKK